MGYRMVIWPVSSLRVANKAQETLYAAMKPRRRHAGHDRSPCRPVPSFTRPSITPATRRSTPSIVGTVVPHGMPQRASKGGRDGQRVLDQLLSGGARSGGAGRIRQARRLYDPEARRHDLSRGAERPRSTSRASTTAPSSGEFDSVDKVIDVHESLECGEAMRALGAAVERDFASSRGSADAAAALHRQRDLPSIHLRADASARHPRVTTCTDLCRAMGWLPDALFIAAPTAELADVLRFHDAEYVAALRRPRRRSRFPTPTATGSASARRATRSIPRSIAAR